MANLISDKTSDASLALRCQLGQQDAWEALVRRWNPRLRAFAWRMLSDKDSVDDVLQIAWLKIVRSLASLRDPERLSAWLYRIVRLTVADHLRRAYRDPPKESINEIGATIPEVQPIVVNEEVESALHHLHPADRECIVLHYFDELSVAEVADVCGVPEGTVKSRLHRARVRLRSLLKTLEHSQ